MRSIVNCSLDKALGDKCHKPTYTRVKQENLVDGGLGYNTRIHLKLYICTTTSASLVMHLRKIFSMLWCIQKPQKKVNANH